MYSCTNVKRWKVVNMDASSDGEVSSINLIKMNDAAYIWNSKDWLRLRSLRIVGCLVGNLAALTKQDRISALPMMLLKEETTLLLEKGYAKLKILSTITEPPNEELHRRSREHREKMLSEQMILLKNERKNEIRSKIDVIIQGKKLKRKKTSNAESDAKELSHDEILLEELNKLNDLNESSLSVQVCRRDPWVTESDLVDSEWPDHHFREPKYLVFKDLWERGYYLSLGEKFGGHYLAYPGDPIRFHAFFIIICLDKNTKLKMQDVITYGRLGQSVKKTVVLSYINEENHICYHSIQWAGY